MWQSMITVSDKKFQVLLLYATQVSGKKEVAMPIKSVYGPKIPVPLSIFSSRRMMLRAWFAELAESAPLPRTDQGWFMWLPGMSSRFSRDSASRRIYILHVRGIQLVQCRFFVALVLVIYVWLTRRVVSPHRDSGQCQLEVFQCFLCWKVYKINHTPQLRTQPLAFLFVALYMRLYSTDADYESTPSVTPCSYHSSYASQYEKFPSGRIREYSSSPCVGHRPQFSSDFWPLLLMHFGDRFHDEFSLLRRAESAECRNSL